jgi:hypothetical protein
MKEVSQSRFIHCGSLALTRDDLRQVYEIIKETIAPPSLRIGNWQVDSADEIDHVKIAEVERVAFDIHHEGGYLSVDIDRDSSRVYVSDMKDAPSLAAATRVAELLKKRRHWGGAYNWRIRMALAITAVTCAVAVAVWLKIEVLAWAVYLVTVLGAMFIGFQQNSVRLLEEAHPNFFVRNRDDLMSKAIFFVLGVGATLLVDFFRRRGLR